MKTLHATYQCDSPGCKSKCTPSPFQDPTEALTAWGWLVLGSPDGNGKKEYCPGCRSKYSGAPTANTDE